MSEDNTGQDISTCNTVEMSSVRPRRMNSAADLLEIALATLRFALSKDLTKITHLSNNDNVILNANKILGTIIDVTDKYMNTIPVDGEKGVGVDVLVVKDNDIRLDLLKPEDDVPQGVKRERRIYTQEEFVGLLGVTIRETLFQSAGTYWGYAESNTDPAIGFMSDALVNRVRALQNALVGYAENPNASVPLAQIGGKEIVAS